MTSKYKVDYAVDFRSHSQTHSYVTDDPIACEEFLVELLERRMRILGIGRDGKALKRATFDKMIRAAASNLAAKHVCASLGIKGEEEKFRFGFAA